MSETDTDDSPEEMKRAFGAALAEARNVRGVHQWQLAEVVGLAQSAISAWEQGEKQPRPHVVFAIEEYLELLPGHLSRHLGYAPVMAARIAPTYEQVVMADDLLDEGQKEAALALYRSFTSQARTPARRARSRK